MPAVLRRFVQLPADKGFVFAPLETAIRLHLGDLFPGMTIDHATMFRVTRDSEYEIEDEEVEDLLKAIEESVRKRINPSGVEDPSIEEAMRRYDDNSVRRDMERAIQRLNAEVDELREIVLQLIDIVRTGN